MKITERLHNKRVLIWGYGREGKSTEHFIKTFCSVAKLDIFEGTAADINEDEYDYIIKSPGIKVDAYSEKYTSQTELFLEEFAQQTIGITGTKGKSTTASLLYHVLHECKGDDVYLVGNIGVPCLDHYADYGEESIIVYEMSCHQLSHLRYSPRIAVLLNLYEDHLDYYGTPENYFAAKKNITVHQHEGDYLFYGANVTDINTPAHTRHITTPHTPFTMRLLGEHNQYNAHFVYEICTQLYDCSERDVRESIACFDGLPHRMQYVGTFGGISYYNDSISTIPQATIQAIRSLPDVKTVIIGGMDRDINYDELISFIQENPELSYILSYESGQRIYREVGDLSYCHYVDDLETAVDTAARITPPGTACLFSPAAASYGHFRNFEDRGDTFMRRVTAMSASTTQKAD